MLQCTEMHVLEYRHFSPAVVADTAVCTHKKSMTSLVDSRRISSVMWLSPAKKVVQQPRCISHGSGFKQRLQPGWGHLAELQHIVAVVNQNYSTIILLMPY